MSISEPGRGIRWGALEDGAAVWATAVWVGAAGPAEAVAGAGVWPMAAAKKARAAAILASSRT